MTKSALYTLTLCFTLSAGGAFAGEFEDVAANAEKTFTEDASSAKTGALIAGDPVPAAADNPAGSAEYKKLAAAFSKGTAPAKENMTGWHAGRYLDRDFPDYPGSILVAGEDMQPADGAPAGTIFKLVAITLDASPSFYETLSPDLEAGVAIHITDQQPTWTNPVFTQSEVTFEKIMPSYDKGFSRYAARKTTDNRILLKHVWKSDMGGQATEGADYAYFTKDVTPK
jgi:hypothetical protein